MFSEGGREGLLSKPLEDEFAQTLEGDSLFPCRLSNGQHIQMLTALVLQLIQCTVVPPKPADVEQKEEKSTTPPEEEAKQAEDKKVCTD